MDTRDAEQMAASMAHSVKACPECGEFIHDNEHLSAVLYLPNSNSRAIRVLECSTCYTEVIVTVEVQRGS